MGHLIEGIREMEDAFFDAPKERRDQLLFMLDGAQELQSQLAGQLEVVA